MKNFQVRIPDDLHSAGKELAQRRGMSLADVVREAMEIHLSTIAHIRAGGRVFHESPAGEKAEVIIPSVSRRFT